MKRIARGRVEYELRAEVAQPTGTGGAVLSLAPVTAASAGRAGSAGTSACIGCRLGLPSFAAVISALVRPLPLAQACSGAEVSSLLNSTDICSCGDCARTSE